MRSASWTWLALGTLLGGCSPEPPPPSARESEPSPPPVIVAETNHGSIVMELDPEKAPETVQNFLAHVRAGFYDSLTFHRVRPGFMIQAGAWMADRRERKTTAFPVPNEAENGLKNVRGAVAMARGSDAHSATTEFFINLVDNEALDFKDKTSQGFGYAVFGRVIEGMEVVDRIAMVPTRRIGRHEAVPLDPVIISSMYVRPDPEDDPA